MPATFSDQAVISLRHLHNKFVRLRPAGRLNDIFVAGLRPAVGDILSNRGGEKERVL